MQLVMEIAGGLALLALLGYGARAAYLRWQNARIAETELEKLLREGQEKLRTRAKKDNAR